MGSCTYTFDPAEHPSATLDASWECPHEAHPESDAEYCIFHMTEEARAQADVSADQVVDEIESNLQKENPRLNEYVGARLPRISFAFGSVNGATNRQLNLQYASIKELDFKDSVVGIGIDLSHATVGPITFDYAVVEGDINAARSTVEGRISATEGIFNRDLKFCEATFEEDALFHEVEFHDRVSFTDARFRGSAEFQVTHFSGKSHELNDNADFSACVFERSAEFNDAQFQAVRFDDAEFRGAVRCCNTRFNNDTLFDRATFDDQANFHEARFHEDVQFSEAVFNDDVDFEGAQFMGGSQTMDDDVSFNRAVFNGEADFEVAHFRYANFKNVDFTDEAHFEEARFEGDADFIKATFKTKADFDESRFYGDADFHHAVFQSTAVFRGAEFEGEAKHLEVNARFDDVRFKENAQFDSATFKTASFWDAEFGDQIDFTESVFKEEVEFRIRTIDTDIYVNFTDAEVYGGEIELLPNDVIPYDFTNATLGDIRLSGEAALDELLDYFRFCLTDFDGFDFSRHYEYLERNGWKIHTFNSNGTDFTPAEPMSNRNIELTYQKAQNTAEDMSLKRAASRFSILRNRYNRRKTTGIIRDDTVAMDSRTKSRQAVSVVVNYFMDKTCGYGNKVPRIFAFTFGSPIVFALIFAVMGAQFAAPEGMTPNVWQASNPLGAIWHSIYFSYVTFSTVGYGDISPITMAAQALAIVEGMMNGMFFALLIYTLTKQSDY